MNFVNSNRYRNMLGVISITKLIALLFMFATVLSNTLEEIDGSNYTSVVSELLCIMSIVLMCVIFVWSFSYIYMFKMKKLKLAVAIEDSFFMIILSIFVFYDGSCSSYHKYLFLFSVISATISFGKKIGIASAVFSGGVILLMDLYFAPNLSVNIYFENDIMLLLTFIIVAWILGEYKIFENDQREVLEVELKEQLEKYNEIDYMLLKNKDSFNLLTTYSDYAIVVHSVDKILYLNKKALELISLGSYEKLNNKSLYEFMKIDNNNDLKTIYTGIINEQKTNVSFTAKILSFNNIEVDVQNTSTYFIYGRIPSILTIMRDITPEIQVEKLKSDVQENVKLLTETKEQNKFITEFFSNISHELKTPLNIIFSSVHMLKVYNDRSEKEIIDKRKTYLNVMKQNSYRLIRLINNILDINKYDAGFINLQLKNGDIVKVIEDITMSIVIYAESKGIEVIFDTDIEEKIIAFDGNKIERIILNLLSNSLKFTNKGGTICVNVLDKGSYIEVSVRDTGIGIPREKLRLIFNRFVQVDKSLKRNNEGTGIGLSLVQSFVRLHGGEITLKSELGHGSEFRFSLPSKQIEEDCTEDEIKSDIVENVNMELSDIYSDEFNNNQ